MTHPDCDKFHWPPPGTTLTLSEYRAATGDNVGCVFLSPEGRNTRHMFFGPGTYLDDTPQDFTPYSEAEITRAYLATGHSIIRGIHWPASGGVCQHYYRLSEAQP